MLNLELPDVSERRVAVRASAAAVRQIRRGHPWLWSGSVQSTSHDGAVGDLAVLFDRNRKFVAIGLWDPTSPIVMRVLHRGDPALIDSDFLARAIDRSIAIRAPLLDDSTTTGYRLVHGENDQLGGLVVDQYGKALVVKIDTAAWLPYLNHVASALLEAVSVDRVVLKASRSADAGLPGSVRRNPTVYGDESDRYARFVENGLQFDADLFQGQKTGHFLDQRDNRSMVASLAVGGTLLDVFCNTGGFGVHAGAAGATHVHSVDSSPYAIEATAHHLNLNVDPRLVQTSSTIGDAFDVLAALARSKQRFDTVIVDPPSFASKARSVPSALAAYRRLTTLALKVLKSGGWLVQASCSSRIDAELFAKTVEAEIAVGYSISELWRTGHPLDHPIGFAEGSYLKAVFCRVDPR